MAFAGRVLRQIVRGDGSLAAHLHHCPYIAIGTKNHIPRPKCNCLHPVWDPHTARDRRPTTIEIGGSSFPSIIKLVMHYHKEWIPPNISFFNCLSIYLMEYLFIKSTAYTYITVCAILQWSRLVLDSCQKLQTRTSKS